MTAETKSALEPAPPPAQAPTGVVSGSAKLDAEALSLGASVVDLHDGSRASWESLTPRTFYARHGKALFDLVALCVFAAPALVLGALVALGNLIAYRDPQRVFFVQQRAGLRGRPFNVYKFRTMIEVTPGTEFDSWGNGDHLRVTRFGRFLRNSHLDELPQLLNVALGDMSLIGPRPEMVEIEAWASEHIDGFSTRLAIKPGITGRAQITQGYTGQDLEAYRRKYEISNAYRTRLSFLGDLSILGRTFLWMLRGRGWRWNASPSE